MIYPLLPLWIVIASYLQDLPRSLELSSCCPAQVPANEATGVEVTQVGPFLIFPLFLPADPPTLPFSTSTILLGVRIRSLPTPPMPTIPSGFTLILPLPPSLSRTANGSGEEGIIELAEVFDEPSLHVPHPPSRSCTGSDEDRN